jgi:hypothetical protein
LFRLDAAPASLVFTFSSRSDGEVPRFAAGLHEHGPVRHQHDYSVTKSNTATRHRIGQAADPIMQLAPRCRRAHESERRARRRRGAAPIEMAVPMIPPHRIRRISAVYHDQPDELRMRISVIQQTSRL